ncbi:alkyl sulfatase C-terminal domain-containing protein [Mycobacterium hubeiense]|uniref:alkyl sulfatase C-terminal domain-containing protein n=1 Tax=Mycobacterium hubeiense TaxID=1867256 RepID=UPI000C7F054E|nr:alkyl sulfatase C-terminal domain-containing protein [Mycobacterium sp. QGD 101]
MSAEHHHERQLYRSAALKYAPAPIPERNVAVTLDASAQNNLTIDGNRESFNEFMGLLDTFPFWFNIVTP